MLFFETFYSYKNLKKNIGLKYKASFNCNASAVFNID